MREFPILRATGCSCASEVTALEGTYVNTMKPSAVFDLRAWPKFSMWEREVTRSRGGGWGYYLRRAARAKLTVERFHPDNWREDWTEIDHSKERRQGREMAWNYKRTLEERGGAPTAWLELPELACHNHWRMCMGVFAPAPKRLVAGREVEKRLVAYVSLIRGDSLLVMSAVLGHSDWLNQGAMPMLFHALVGIMLVPDEKRPPSTQGIRFILYGGWGDGADGLKSWKRIAGFTSGRLVTA